MRVTAIGLLAAACAPPATAPIANHAAGEPSTPVDEAKLLFDRRLTVGARMPANRSTWQLSLDGDHATLVSTDQESPGSITVALADRATNWTGSGSQVEKGPMRHDGDHLALDLESAKDSLFLRCWRKTLVVATAGAVRVPTPGHVGDCSDPGVWSPATTTRIEALVCGQGDGLDDGQLAGLDGQAGSLDETLWRFAAAPGIEFVEVNDDCFESAGLRVAK